jgi:uncharacterized protein YkwD
MRSTVTRSLSRSFALLLACAVSFGALSACTDDRPSGPAPLAPTAIPDETHGPSTPADIDGDGVPNESDNCPTIANADQRNACHHVPAPALTGNVANDAVAHMNWMRESVGLGPVTEDPTLSHGCAVHLDYLVALSAELGSPQLAHQEDLSKSYASAEGNEAGINSVLSMGEGEIASAIDGWMETLYHRLPLIHPGLTSIGVAVNGTYSCLQYRPGTDGSVQAPHEIFWPPADIQETSRTFGGSESPCPTIDDPLSGGSCPGSAAIASIGLNGLGAMSGVTATLRNVDTGADVPLYRVYYDGGPTPHEQAGYLDGTIALVPPAGSSLDLALYEATVQLTLAGTPQSFRWRFRTGTPLPTDVACDADGAHHDLATALPVGVGESYAKVCDAPDFFRITGAGVHTVEIRFVHADGDLDLNAYDAAGAPAGTSAGQSDSELVTVPEGGAVEVFGFNGATGTYQLRVR